MQIAKLGVEHPLANSILLLGQVAVLHPTRALPVVVLRMPWVTELLRLSFPATKTEQDTATPSKMRKSKVQSMMRTRGLLRPRTGYKQQDNAAAVWAILQLGVCLSTELLVLGTKALRKKPSSRHGRP